MESEPVLATGVVIQTLIGGTGHSSVEAPSIELTWGGVVSDRHCALTRYAGAREREYAPNTPIFNVRQVSAVAVHELAAIAKQLNVPTIPAEDLGANLLLDSSVPITLLPTLATIWFSSGAVLLHMSANSPCKSPGRLLAARYAPENEQQAFSARFIVAARNLRGNVSMVQRQGSISPGDTFEIRVPKEFL